MATALVLFIGTQCYNLFPLDGELIAWRLIKADGEIYDAHKDKHGTHCSCADATFRKEGTRRVCKHVKALQEMRMI